MTQNQKPSQSVTNSQFQLKYHKAIKEISKLVSVNTAAKKEIYSLKSICQKVQNKFDSLSLQHQNLQKQYEQLKKNSSHDNATLKKMSIQTPVQESQIQLQQTGSISEFVDAKKRLVEYEEKLFEQQNIISSLEHRLQQSVQLNEKLNKECGFINQQMQQSQMQVQKSRNQQKVLNQQNNRLNEECEDLRKKVLGYERGSLTSISTVHPGSPLFQKLSFFSKNDPEPILRQRVNTLTSENKKLEQKYKVKKEKYNFEMQQLKGENKKLTQKINRMMVFMDKQQRYIQSFEKKM